MSLEKLMDSFSLTRRGRGLGKVFLLLLIVIMPLAFPVQVEAGLDKCWAGSSRYKVGQTVTIYAYLAYTDFPYYLVIAKPDGKYNRYYLGYGPGTISYRGTVGDPLGTRTVTLYRGNQPAARCYYEVYGAKVYVKVYVYAGLHDPGGPYPLQGAIVYLGSVSAGTLSNGMVAFWAVPKVYSLSIYYRGRLLVTATIVAGPPTTTMTWVFCLICGKFSYRGG